MCQTDSFTVTFPCVGYLLNSLVMSSAFVVFPFFSALHACPVSKSPAYMTDVGPPFLAPHPGEFHGEIALSSSSWRLLASQAYSGTGVAGLPPGTYTTKQIEGSD